MSIAVIRMNGSAYFRGKNLSAEVNTTLDDDISPDDVIAPVKTKPRAKRKKKLTAHRAAYLVHSFIGLKLSLLFTIVLATGTIAVINEELDWLIYDEMRVTPQAERLNEGELMDRLDAAYPNAGVSFLETANQRPHMAAMAQLSSAEGGFQKVWIDPYTGTIKGETDFLTVGTFFSILHTRLYMPVIGRALVNVFGVLCLIGLISGLISYRRFWREFFTLPRWNAKPRIFLGDLHKFIGLWSLWFVLIMGVTGTWWFYHNPLVFYKVAPPVLPATTIEPQLSHQDLDKLGVGIPNRLSSADIIDAVKMHDPDFAIQLLRPPEHNGQAYRVMGTKGELLTSSRDSSYYVHPYTGEIIGDRLVKDITALQRFDYAMVPLHYGTWGNEGASDLAVKFVWFIFGLAMTVLSVSGMIIYYQRTRSATNKLLPEQPTKRFFKKSWFVFRPWGGPMSGFKYLNWAFITVACIGISIAFTLQREGASGSGFQYAKQHVGEWTISLNATAGLLEKDLPPIRPGRQTNMNVFIHGGNPKAIKFMHIKARKPRTMRAPGAVVHGQLGNQHSNTIMPKKIKDNAKLWVTIEDWHGNFHQASWPLMPDGEQTIDLRINNQEITNHPTLK